MNIVLIAVDTLRAAQLSCYGYVRATTPTMDDFARQGALFERMICSAIPTHPSFTTIYTGQHPMTHGIVAHSGDAVLERRTPTLPGILLRNGWTTCALDNLASAKSWFQTGYEFYIDPSRRRSLGLMVTCDQQNARAIEFLKNYGDEQFFLFIHYWDPHTPYLPPKKYREMFYDGDIGAATDPNNRSLEPLWRHPLGAAWRDTWFKALGGKITDSDYVRALYDGSIRYADDGINNLLTALDEIGKSDDTLVVIMGDHGECLGEHDVWYDHHGLYDENMRVPFMARWPGRLPDGVRVETTAQTMDVAPTILDLADVEIPDSMDGQSLVPLIDPHLSSRPPYEEPTRLFTPECTWQAKWSMSKPESKFILARSVDYYGSPPRELYDTGADPGETTNIAEQDPTLADELEGELEDWIASEASRLGRAGDPVIEQGREKFAARWANRST